MRAVRIHDGDFDGECDDLMQPYRAVGRSHIDGRPWVLANMVGGLDGSAAMGGRVGALSEGADSELFLRLRSVADCILVGAETVRRERYGPVTFSPVDQAWRTASGLTPGVPIAVVSRSLDLDPTIGMFAHAAPEAPPIVLTPDDDDVASVIGTLAGLGHRVILCEGGPNLLGQLVAAGLVDELCLTLSPVIGGDDLRVAATPPDARPTGFDLVGLAVDGSTLLLRYERIGAREEGAS